MPARSNRRKLQETQISVGSTAASGTTAFWTPSASVSWTTVTLSTAFDCALLYNSTQSDKAVAVLLARNRFHVAVAASAAIAAR